MCMLLVAVTVDYREGFPVEVMAVLGHVFGFGDPSVAEGSHGHGRYRKDGRTEGDQGVVLAQGTRAALQHWPQPIYESLLRQIVEKTH
jgi:hypothetical protein